MYINLDIIRRLLLQMVRCNPETGEFESANLSFSTDVFLGEAQYTQIKRHADLMFFSGLTLRGRSRIPGGDGAATEHEVYSPTQEARRLIYCALHDVRWSEIEESLSLRLECSAVKLSKAS